MAEMPNGETIISPGRYETKSGAELCAMICVERYKRKFSVVEVAGPDEHSGPPEQEPSQAVREQRAGCGALYVASKTKHAAKWRELRARGLPVVASWIDEAGEGQTKDFADLAMRCIREATTADYVLLYVEPGETHKGSLVEVGAALAAGVPVRCVGDSRTVSKTFRHHPLWSDHPSVEAAVRHNAESSNRAE